MVRVTGVVRTAALVRVTGVVRAVAVAPAVVAAATAADVAAAMLAPRFRPVVIRGLQGSSAAVVTAA